MANLSDGLWTDEEQAYWLAFDRVSVGLGAKRLTSLYEQMGTLKTIWTGSKELLEKLRHFSPETIGLFLQQRNEIDPERIFQEVVRSGVRAYPYYHPEFPFRLREIHDPPLVVYMKGELTPHDLRHSCGIVGTRRPTMYGQKWAKEFAHGLARNGVTVVSGMAVGIDSLAHWGAIESGGKTVAVLATGPDICYPSSNKPLYRKMMEDPRCAVLSEFFPGIKPDSWRFPARNRIISGLSQAVIVVEAGETSGSLITAKIAFEQNREVFAIPGRIDSPASAGTNELIKRQTAHLCRGFDDVMKAMSWVQGAPVRDVPTVVELYGREREVYELISAEPVHFDYLCEKCGMLAPELSATLTMLELAGVVTRHPGDWYSRDRSITMVE